VVGGYPLVIGRWLLVGNGEMNLLVSKKSWVLAPVMYLLALGLLAITWSVMDPASLRGAFDADGRSFFETLTIPFYALIVPAVWLCCPFSGSAKRKMLLCAGVSCVAVMAIVKQLDIHLSVLQSIYPDVVANFKGTPFKMRFLTRGGIPFGAKLVVVSYFVLFFGVFAAMLAYYFPKLVKGFFRLHPVAWSMAFFGISGVTVQVCDRLPAWYRHAKGIAKSEILGSSFQSFCTAFEEGGEMMIAAFALVAILQAHAIYSRDTPPVEFAEL
jgi:hypothetical protein